MLNTPTVILISSLVLASGYSVRSTAKNTVQDAHDQLTKSIRCWEPIDVNNPSKGYTMSEPIYELCSYMPDPKDYNKYYVNGVQMDSDDYTNILAMYGNPIPGHAVINVCLQEAFQFHAANHPSQVSLRCLCKRDGCNLPKGFTTFLDFNKLPMPEVFY
ncbi:dietary restriction over expressed [Caenorhabditis elegans]|uniref:Dietary restriction over expressed n=1 Tax=Caenorhabditis elegans TaxID=6239 RepID=Q9XUW9_CAEEL|nr:dietary restriction over expressed [Caenorhabditis elegans]CAB04514.1 dietary restriction over expressed [Caenorhabditis elegans]|eukprot:NP_506477.1 dietary restriction over expressed [Caenorhabditis elegans]